MLCFYNETLKIDVAILFVVAAAFLFGVFTISWHEHYFKIEERKTKNVDTSRRRK
jgi:hypothetical protein